MLAAIARKLNQLSRRAGLIALTGFAFSVGTGVGALAVTAQHASARVAYVPASYVDDELFASREAPEVYGVTVGAEYVAPAPDVHTVASALRIEAAPRAPQIAAPGTGPLYTPAAVAQMVPGEQAAARLTFYYCSGGVVGDGGGFCGHAADGTPVQPGVAACDRQYLGQKFRVLGDPSGMVFRCADTGSGVFGQLRDLWFETPDAASAWFASVGHSVTIEVLD
jgi:hypothetical protein